MKRMLSPSENLRHSLEVETELDLAHCTAGDVLVPEGYPFSEFQPDLLFLVHGRFSIDKALFKLIAQVFYLFLRYEIAELFACFDEFFRFCHADFRETGQVIYRCCVEVDGEGPFVLQIP